MNRSAARFGADEPIENDPASIRKALRLVARREHTLLSLSELSQELTVSLDLFTLADLVLFNIMGQLGTSRSALWLTSEREGSPVLVRCHGINRQIAKAVGTSCAGTLAQHLAKELVPRPIEELEAVVGVAAIHLIDRAEIGLFAPIAARGEMLGLLGLGQRIGAEPYGEVETQTLQAALGMVGVAIQNVTFYNRLLENNRQLRLANQTLTGLDRLKSEFLSNVNHELRTPLTNIIAYVDCLLDPRQGSGHTEDFLRVVMDEALKLKGLLENLLAFSSVNQEKLELDLVPGDVGGPLTAYFEERMPGVTEGMRELVLSREQHLPMVRFDEHRMLQVVDALIENAVKFTGAGTRIEIRARRVDVDRQAWVAIDVEDDGPGIPKDRLPTLFEPFHQVDGSSTRTVGGMGIGLAFAHQLTQRMGGRLIVASDIGRGSTFTLLLPAA